MHREVYKNSDGLIYKFPKKDIKLLDFCWYLAMTYIDFYLISCGTACGGKDLEILWWSISAKLVMEILLDKFRVAKPRNSDFAG